MTTKILDIDLDFFLSDVALRRPSNKRLDDWYIPWQEVEVCNYLENYCGLDDNAPIPGKMLVKHDELFWIWKRMIERGFLEIPFDVIHIDAHADLGLGDSSWVFLISELLQAPVVERTRILDQANILSEGNFLVFSIACGWIDKLTYVCHPTIYERHCHGLGDLPLQVMKDWNLNADTIQLRAYDLQESDDYYALKEAKPVSIDPEVDFELISGECYRASSSFSYAFLTQSPSYTPKKSDQLIPVIMQYIDSWDDWGTQLDLDS